MSRQTPTTTKARWIDNLHGDCRQAATSFVACWQWRCSALCAIILRLLRRSAGAQAVRGNMIRSIAVALVSRLSGASNDHRPLMLIAAASIVLLLGAIYYGAFRWWLPSTGIALHDPSYGTFPSLAHMLALSWLALGFLGRARGAQLSVLLLAVSFATEPLFGTFDPLDNLFACIGWALGLGSGLYWLRGGQQRVMVATPFAGGMLLLLSTALTTGSYCTHGCVSSSSGNADPVYLSYQELRSSVAVEEPLALGEIKRVYVYQSAAFPERRAIFLNRENEGIHVLDNSDPRNPVNIAFISIPGNTEISIRDDYLYADSYIDLVTLDISDPQNVREVDRVQEVFPYDEYQNIPLDIFFDYDAVDQSRGVVVSYVRKD
jgi:hypothetical protein